jgi:drug/metabolite transporter (DMT)-like permease
MLWAVFFFALMNVCAKGLQEYPTMEIVFFRCVISILLSFWWLKQVSVSWKGTHTLQLIGRGMAGTTALYLFFLTIQHMPLATAVTIQYLSPIFTALLAIVMLKESIKPIQWLFFGLSFLGVAMLKGLDERVSWLYFALGILSAFFSGIAYVLVRSLKGKEHPLVVVFYFQIVGTVVGGGFSLTNFRIPHGWEWTLLLAVGLFAHFGQVNLTKAIQGEKVGIISSLNFFGAIFASIFGWLLFNEAVTRGNVAAMAMVIAGVMMNIWTNAGRSFGLRKFVTNLLTR